MLALGKCMRPHQHSLWVEVGCAPECALMGSDLFRFLMVQICYKIVDMCVIGIT